VKGFTMPGDKSYLEGLPKTRPTSKLNPKVDHRLIAYAAAASATGVAMLALARPADAEVVFTPTNVTIGGGSSYLLDLNNDGIADFTLHRCRCVSGSGHSTTFRAEIDVTGNGIVNAALSAGVLIGRGQPFITTNGNYGGAILARAFYYLSISRFSGPFANATNRFLGLKFLIDGKNHYGWARLTVTNFNHAGTATLTGYAYETVPNHAIRAGQRKETTASAVDSPILSEPASTPLGLGLLARGDEGLSLWRREENATLPLS
jgi:hypothetical protein